MKTFLILLFFPSLLIAQVDSTDMIVLRMMNQQKVVGLSLAVVKDGLPIVNKGYGLANVELNVPVTSETVIRLGSVSKQFFATAIMKLMEEGKLTLDDPLHKFFPDAPEAWRQINIKHMMSHTSGLPREGPAYDNFVIQTDLDIIKSAYNLPLEFKTGEKYQYCNLGYYMLAQIITQLSGMPWQDYIHDKLFMPAQMSNSYVTDFYLIIPNRASGYMHQNDTLVNAYPMYAIRPSGGFLSTSSDMIKWEKTIREGKTILKKDNWEKLWQPFVKMTDQLDSKEYYGFGWAIDEYMGRKIVVHGGSNPGFKSVIIRFVNDDLCIIINANSSEANPHDIGFALADYYFKK
jgi:CubicO group peptidase (beta-lactamase class C family)